MMFAVLFGLSMDYEVFLLTSFREHWDRTGDVAVAVRRALADTGQVITSAALIMVGVFSSFVLADQTVAKMFGVGLATAVALDATLVRCVLVPSIMVLAAKGTFWLPGWLDRLLPQVHVEGDPAALTSIHEPADPVRPSATQPAATMAAVAVGIAVAWFVGVRLLPESDVAPFADIAIAVAAVAGGVVAWLPRGLPGAGRGTAARLLALLGGALLTLVLYAVARSAVPPVQARIGWLAGLALLGCAAAAALPLVRRLALPVVLGGMALAVTVGVDAGATDPFGMLVATLVPATLALVLARAVQGLLHPQRPLTDPPLHRGADAGAPGPVGAPPAEPQVLPPPSGEQVLTR
jgi:RND superfamily putative drug exporter